MSQGIGEARGEGESLRTVENSWSGEPSKYACCSAASVVLHDVVLYGCGSRRPEAMITAVTSKIAHNNYHNMKSLNYCKNYQNVTQRHKVSRWLLGKWRRKTCSTQRVRIATKRNALKHPHRDIQLVALDVGTQRSGERRGLGMEL